MDQLKITLAGVMPEREAAAKTQLERILQQYDLTKYFFTKQILIESQTIPHSHPVLTLNTKYLNNDKEVLSIFIHEQLHWFEHLHQDSIKNAITNLKEIYTDVPVGFPNGARSEESTYLHLIICWLEYYELKLVVRESEAKNIIEQHDHYLWIFQTVIDDYSQLEEIITRNNLLITS